MLKSQKISTLTPPPSAPPLEKRGGLNKQEFYNLYRIITYLKHLLTATNQHGVHSPFVYDYLTKCLYSKPRYKASKSENVVLKSIPYFSIQKLKTDTEDSHIENRIWNELKTKVSQETPLDLIYLGQPKTNVLSHYGDQIHNDSMIVMENIYKNKEATLIWNTLIENERITVSIDMFYCGAIFFRREQVKQHFKIRI